MYNVSETVLPIYINGQCPIIKTCSDVTLNLSSKDSTNREPSEQLFLRRCSFSYHSCTHIILHIKNEKDFEAETNLTNKSNREKHHRIPTFKQSVLNYWEIKRHYESNVAIRFSAVVKGSPI